MTLDTPLAQPPGFLDAIAVLVLETGHVTAYDLEAGKPIWSVEGTASRTPVLASGRAFLVRDGTIAAIDLRDGGTLWETAVPVTLAAPVSAAGGWLFTVDEAGHVTAYRAEDGSRVWSVDAGGPTVQPVSSEGERVYVPRQDGIILSLRVGDGSRVWERRVGGVPQPVLALSDRVYVGADDNYVYCLKASDGQVDWRWRTGGDIVGVPGFDEDRIYVVSLDTLLRGLDRRSGAQRWKQELSLRPTRGLVAGAGALLVSGMSQTIQGVTMKDGAAAGTIDAGGLLAAPPHVAPAPSLPSSLVVFVARSLTAGTTMTAVTRSLEPAATPVQPLPDPNAPKTLPGGATPDGTGTAPPPVGEPPAGLPPTAPPAVR